jgi:hypothetical protein
MSNSLPRITFLGYAIFGVLPLTIKWDNLVFFHFLVHATEAGHNENKN